MNAPSCHPRHQAGAFSVEFAIVLTLFLSLVFGVIELARAMYIFNTLHEVTRRAASAAANMDYRYATNSDSVRQGAIFRSSPGSLVLGDPVTDAHIRIDYLSLVDNGGGNMTLTQIPAGALPTCPARNRLICLKNPNDSSCIRFVRVRVCDPGESSTCNPVEYKTMISLIPLPLTLPTAVTIVPAESLGFTPGMTPCP